MTTSSPKPRRTMRADTEAARSPTSGSKPAVRRMSVEERERQILDGAIAFFSECGLDGQMRELAQRLGMTHPLLYHYFPGKRALIERVYQEIYLGRWRSEWEHWIDDQTQPLRTRLVRFYTAYAGVILTKEWVRILVFSGLSDRYIPDQYMELLQTRLLPRIWRETRRELGLSTRAKESEAERELIWGLHGGIFYIGIRHWIYGLPMPQDMGTVVSDRVSAYLLAAPEVFGRVTTSEPAVVSR